MPLKNVPKASSPKYESFEDTWGGTGEKHSLSIDQLQSFPAHKFKLYGGERLAQMIESVAEFGVLLPLIVWKKSQSDYIILSGHNRKAAAEAVGLQEVPVLLRENLTEEEATLIVTESNLRQRSFSDLLHSERAYCLEQHYQASKKQGKRSDLMEEVSALLDGLTYVHSEQKRDDSGTFVHSEQKRDDSGTFVHSEQKRDDSGTFVHSEQKRDESSTFVHSEQKRDDSGTSVHGEHKLDSTTSVHGEQKSGKANTRAYLSQNYGISPTTFGRYVKIASLDPSLMDLLDQGTLNFLVAYELAFIADPRIQQTIAQSVATTGRLSQSLAKALRQDFQNTGFAHGADLLKPKEAPSSHSLALSKEVKALKPLLEKHIPPQQIPNLQDILLEALRLYGEKYPDELVF